MEGTGLKKASEILVDQFRALDNHRFLEKLGKLNPEEILDLRGKLGTVMDF